MNIEKIKQILESSELPGINSHRKFAPKYRLRDDYNPEPKGAIKSAVMLLLYEKNGEIVFPVILRTNNGHKHSGQISFPGGHYEDYDKNVINNALRETEEEIGVKKEDIKIIRQLSPLYIEPTNFTVYPVVGFLDYVPEFKIQESEVVEVLEIPLKELLNPNIIIEKVTVENKTFDTKFYKFKNTRIWGATAMILAEFADIIKT